MVVVCLVAPGGCEKVCKSLLEKPGEERQLGRPRHIWENNIKMDLREIELESANWSLYLERSVRGPKYPQAYGDVGKDSGWWVRTAWVYNFCL
jgi:hypothetical protein